MTRYNWQKIASIMGVLAAMATILGFLFKLSDEISRVITNVTSMENKVQRVEQQIVKNRFRITYPSEAAFVELTDMVQGVTPYSDRNHYIVVTPIETGDSWIQAGPLKVYNSGLWMGRARFGTAATGTGKRFIIRAIATKSVLLSGALARAPKDAIFSDPVSVTRK